MAGLGGGMVTLPNMTLTLQHVSVAMAGAAGEAVQTMQRIGGAIGTTALARSSTTSLSAPATIIR